MIEVRTYCYPLGPFSQPILVGTLTLTETSRHGELVVLHCVLQRRRDATPVECEITVPVQDVETWVVIHAAMDQLVALERPARSTGLGPLDQEDHRAHTPGRVMDEAGKQAEGKAPSREDRSEAQDT